MAARASRRSLVVTRLIEQKKKKEEKKEERKKKKGEEKREQPIDRPVKNIEAVLDWPVAGRARSRFSLTMDALRHARDYTRGRRLDTFNCHVNLFP